MMRYVVNLAPARALIHIGRTREGTKSRLGPPASELFQEFVSLCMTVEPSERPTADELLKHRFIKKYRGQKAAGLMEVIQGYQEKKAKNESKQRHIGDVDAVLRYLRDDDDDDTTDSDEGDAWNFDATVVGGTGGAGTIMVVPGDKAAAGEVHGQVVGGDVAHDGNQHKSPELPSPVQGIVAGDAVDAALPSFTEGEPSAAIAPVPGAVMSADSDDSSEYTSDSDSSSSSSSSEGDVAMSSVATIVPGRPLTEKHAAVGEATAVPHRTLSMFGAHVMDRAMDVVESRLETDNMASALSAAFGLRRAFVALEKCPRRAL